jgi:hypothetical protein
MLRIKTRCIACGAIGATIRLPIWVDSAIGHAAFLGAIVTALGASSPRRSF